MATNNYGATTLSPNGKMIARVSTAAYRAYLVSYCHMALEDVYRFPRMLAGIDDKIATDIVVADYDTMMDLIQEYHNELRTIWRCRRHVWLEPLKGFSETLDDPRKSWKQ